MEIKEVELEGERIYLKKSKIFGWGIVKPIKIDGKINWYNLLLGGSWIKSLSILVFILILLGCLYEYSQAVKVANECLKIVKIFPLLN